MTRVRVALDGPVGRLTLARPDKRNALDAEAAAELRSGLDRCAREPGIRVVLLAADGPDFCAGADLAALEHMLDAEPAAHYDDAMALGAVFIAMREIQKPIVAAVRGRALAGGAGLASACDIVLAEDGARFGYPEVRVGFVPAMVMTMLRRAVGEKRAFELVATGRQLNAAEALALGLVSRVLPRDTFDADVDAVVQSLAAAPPGALALTKRLFYALDGVGFREGIELGARTNVEARSSTEFRDGVRRFVQRGGSQA